MVDISGYSALTSNLSSLGKLSSELITNAVSGYMDQIVAVIYALNGDVIKFLGDAILVCFNPLPDEIEAQVAERAAYCCLHISAHFSTLSVDLTKARQDYVSTGEMVAYRSVTHKHILPNSGVGTDDSLMNERATLRIHVALTAGTDVEHVIVGLNEKRLDYTIHGACMRDLGVMLDSTKEGEFGISSALLAVCSNSFRGAVRHLSASASKGAAGYILKTEDDFKLFLGLLAEAQPSLPNLLSHAVADSPQLHPFSPPELENEGITESVYQLAKLFVNESLLHKFEASKTSRLTVKRQKSTLSSSSRQDLDSAIDTLLRVATTSSVADQIIKGEFRIISIVFIKLLSEFTPKRAQAAMEAFVHNLRKWEGVYQQYSVDDKGQTMLGCFGLPPYTHEKDALYALKAALEFNSFVQKTPEIGKVSISVCTGEILFSKLGNQYRADTSLLGDAVNVAARLLSVSGSSGTSSVKCDAATYKLTKEDFHHTFMGAQMVKGKAEAIDVYSVLARDDTSNTVDVSLDRHATTVYGYEHEREMLLKVFRKWYSGEQNQRVVVMGKSGIGKSALLAEIAQKLTLYVESLIQGSELKQNMPFVSLQTLAQFIFKLFTDTVHGTNIAREPKARKLSIMTESTLLFKVYKNKSTNLPRRSVASRGSSAKGDDETNQLPLVADFLTYLGESADLAPLLSDAPGVERLLLNGLAEADVQDIIVTKFSCFGVKKMDTVTLSDEEMDLEDLEIVIEEQDIYDYLVKKDAENTQVYFRHIQIQNSIYESQPYAERAKLHLAYAEHLESMLTDASRDFLLPTLAYHYQKTDKVDKKILYLEEIGLKLHKKGHTRECVSYLNMLLNVCIANPTFEVEAHRKGGWIARLASARSQVPLITAEELELCMQSLKLLGRPWPGNKKELKRATLAAAWELFRLWRATNGGMRPETQRWCLFSRPKGEDGNANNVEELELALLNYMTLYRLGIYSNVFAVKSNFGLLYLRTLNTSILYASADKIKWAYALFHVTLGISTTVPRLARLFYKQGKRVEATMTTADEKNGVVSTYYLKALVAFSYANILESAKCARLYISYTESRGDTNMASAAYNMLHIALNQSGDLTSHDAVFERLSNEKSFYKAGIAKSQLYRHILMNNDDTTNRFLKITEEAAAEMAIVMPHPINSLHVPVALCWLTLHDGKFKAALEHFEVVVKPEHQVKTIHVSAYETYLFFPHLACMLAIPCVTNPRVQSLGSGTVHKWSKDDTGRILEGLDKMNLFVDNLATKGRLDVFFWPLIIGQACKLLLEGHRRTAAQK
ncbi:hypothetical protein HDV05_007938, partial [Chytridiales sp. JEL 0842]